MQRTGDDKRRRVSWRGSRLFGALGAVLGLVASKAAQAQTGVACVGDSITQNSGWCEDLGTLLGANYDAVNYGLSGTTLLKMGDNPYWNSTQFAQSHDFGPGIVVIMLGTNDSKPQNWTFKDQFVGDYEALIDSYRALPSVPKIYLNLPPPAGTNGFGISGTVIENEVVPLVRQVAAEKHTGLIDIFAAFGGHDFDASLFGSAGDQVHPNGAGAQRIADTVYAALTAPPILDAGADAASVDASGASEDASAPSAGTGGGGAGNGISGNSAGGNSGSNTAGSSVGGGGTGGMGDSADAGSPLFIDEGAKKDHGCDCRLASASNDEKPWSLGLLVGAVLVASCRRRIPSL